MEFPALPTASLACDRADDTLQGLLGQGQETIDVGLRQEAFAVAVGVPPIQNLTILVLKPMVTWESSMLKKTHIVHGEYYCS